MLRIALTSDPEIPVPPTHYGGIERVIDILARGLVARGHEVTVFANKSSDTSGRLIAWPGANSTSAVDSIRNAVTLCRHVVSEPFDLVHSFSRLAYIGPLLPARIPKLMTYQRYITRRSVQLGATLSRGTLWFSAISRAMMRDIDDVGLWRLVYNGVDLDRYHFNPTVADDAPLVFLGRVEEIKGPHLAIDIARKARLPLIIAGNVPREHERWFEENVLPKVDGKGVRYIGPVTDVEKNALLGQARALLMPILWEEPFGIVMAEAMACGTPVIGFPRGSVPELVDPGKTGLIADNVDALAAAVQQTDKLDRRACRARAEQMFSADAVVDGYLSVYNEMLSSR